ncbi:MAG TPA: Gfo/Idh/MocA family oxidoreductase [Verrucomicrobiota bacterium]|nr:oxidoreductase [Verrucomicrobiales bacterium]HRI13434.1 Gfo/Idh/MocA family oxidoreductase [Verrucomicrobiota bacterium]
MLNIGIIGTGFMAAQHLKAYRQVANAKIAALCNPSGRHLDGDFSQVGGNVGDAQPLRLDMTQVKAYRDSAALFDDAEIQAVDICTPTKTHVELALGALAAGKHVVIEKPLARNGADARRIADAAEVATQRGVFLMPAMCIRFWPEYAWVKERIVSGEFGRVLDARFRRVASSPAWGHSHFLQGAESGGALFDLHVHDVDFIQYCFGQPRSVFASGYRKVSGAIDHVMALFQYPNGPTVSAEGSWAMAEGFPFNMSFTVNFEGATADYDLARGAEAFRLTTKGSTQTIKLEAPDGYVGELRYFVESVLAGRPPSRVTARDASSVIELCEAEERSVETHQSESLS